MLRHTTRWILGCAAVAAFTAHAQERCKPVETRRTEATGQHPAFAGQTRACEVKSNVAFDVKVIAKGLEHPWSVDPFPDGRLLVTERPGRMRLVGTDGRLGAPIEGVLAVMAKGQGGLFDIALSPQFASDRTIFWSFAEPREGGGNATSVATGRLSDDGRRLEGVKVIFRAR